MLRTCCWQRPTCALHLVSRSAWVIASHASAPIFSLPASSAAATMRRLTFSSQLHVSPWMTVFSLSRCMPIESDSGAPAAAQLPSPNLSSWRAFHPLNCCRPCAIRLVSMDFAIASALPPDVSVAPRCNTSTLVPGASCGSICVFVESRPKPYLVDSSEPKEMMRSDLPTRKLAMHSPAMVSSMRRPRNVRSVGSEYSTSGACTRSTSRIFAPMAPHGVRRAICAHSIGRSRQSSALNRPFASRREPADVRACSSSVDVSAASVCASAASRASSRSNLSSLTSVSAACARFNRFRDCLASSSTSRARARAFAVFAFSAATSPATAFCALV
eukprot:1660834-Prymnesium_polylepis.3